MSTYCTFSFGVSGLFNFSFSLGCPANILTPTSTKATSERDPDSFQLDALSSARVAVAKTSDITSRVNEDLITPREHTLLGNTSKLMDYPSKREPSPGATSPDSSTEGKCSHASQEIAIAVQDSPLFSKCATEIRLMIYKNLLVVSGFIIDPHRQLAHEKPIVLSGRKPIPGLDARIMRTCGAIYIESIPVLYGLNRFRFCSKKAVRWFQANSSAVSRFSSVPNFSPLNTPEGRLTLLRTVLINFGPKESDDLPSLSGRIIARGTHRSAAPPNREKLWHPWAYDPFSDYGNRHVGFPALENLTLDFSDWMLTDAEGLVTQSIIDMFGPLTSGGEARLQKLVVNGISHKPTLQKLKNGLVKRGGIFKIINPGSCTTQL
ncbi:hypothetical protein N7G274_005449 [Stereocaulon virgatum]|uniref:LAGLIDADG homing endonuclease n=1 Tax=Stereocaulon virgatum TaxID=373712 RepID=A0ABR4A855_9LECA